MKKKPSSIPVRIDKDVLSTIEPLKEKHGSWNKTLSNIIAKVAAGTASWALPSDIFNTKSQAMGESLKRAVQQGIDPSEKETPIKVTQVEDVI